MKIVLASSNQGKMKEFEFLCREHPVLKLEAQGSYGVADVPETGLTFVENALIKARHAARQTGLPALGDDSGLVVRALGGAPGIYSARYAGVSSTAAEKIEKLLTEMKGIPENNRDAFYYCCLVLVQHADDQVPLICEAKWHGRILTAPIGEQGFGYDPIFYVPDQACSVAELTMDNKNKSSHRAQAMQKLLSCL